MQWDLGQVVDVFNLALFLPRGKYLLVSGTDPLGYLVGQSVYGLGNAVGLGQHFDVIGTSVEQLHVHTCPSVNGLVVITSDPHVVCRRSNLLGHLPLQRSEVLGLVNKQVV